jgi:hypothetical protein
MKMVMVPSRADHQLSCKQKRSQPPTYQCTTTGQFPQRVGPLTVESIAMR